MPDLVFGHHHQAGLAAFMRRLQRLQRQHDVADDGFPRRPKRRSSSRIRSITDRFLIDGRLDWLLTLRSFLPIWCAAC